MSAFSQFKNETAKAEYESYCKECDSRWPIQSNESFITTSYGDTFVRESGRGEVLVLLPGLQVSSLSYVRMVEELSHHFHVYAVDIVGDFGKSIQTKAIESEEDYTEWLHELFTGLNLPDSVSLLGTSLGAWLGSLYSIKHPGRISNLILISPSAVVAEMNRETMITGLLLHMFPFARKIIFRKTFRNILKTKPEAKELLDKEIYEPMAIINRCFKPGLPLVPKRLSVKEIQNIQAKVLYFVGEDETLYNAKEGKKYFDTNFTNGESVLVPNAGHDLIMIQPDRIVKKVIEFMGRK